MICPHCNQPLSPEQITKLWAQLSASKRKVHSGGKNGGRPSCTCGTCRKCRAREAQRRRRAEETK